MPRGIEKTPKILTKLTAVSMSCNGRKINTFIHLPIIGGKAVLPNDIVTEMEKDLGAGRGDTVSLG